MMNSVITAGKIPSLGTVSLRWLCWAGLVCLASSFSAPTRSLLSPAKHARSATEQTLAPTSVASAHDPLSFSAASAFATPSLLCCAQSNGDGVDENDDPDVFNDDLLQQRMQDLQEREEAAQDELISTVLSRRIREMQESEQVEDAILRRADDSESDGHILLDLPTVCFDAILPGQLLEGRTEDPTFIQFLRNLGLGGWFVMISLDNRTRKVRRHGSICKLELIGSMQDAADDNSDGTGIKRTARIPTAVDFVIKGMHRARVVGPTQDCKLRIGRWRRGYDPNGEEVVLGWGEERFLDWSADVPNPYERRAKVEKKDGMGTSESVQQDRTDGSSSSLSDSQWSSNQIQCLLPYPDKHVSVEQAERAASLQVLVHQWFELAANSDTYQHHNVTAVPVRTILPNKKPKHESVSTSNNDGDQNDKSVVFLCDPGRRLLRILEALNGDIQFKSRDASDRESGLAMLAKRPDPMTHTTEFCYWVAALINPLPPLGISPEIRGRILEATNLEQRLDIVEAGLMRSIDNLQGRRRL